jgi:hypothetical protein
MFRFGRIALAFGLATLALLSIIPGTALAHERVNVGRYELVIGWAEEPPLLGEPNGITLRITDTEAGQPVSEVTTINLSVTTGGQTRDLELEPRFNAPGEYAADIIPTVRGVYSVRIAGSIEQQDVDTSVDIEEVAEPEGLQFPVTLPSGAKIDEDLSALRTEDQGLRDTVARNQLMAAGGLVLGLAGLIIGLVSLRRR